jgi:hypothetical protein
MQFIHLWHPGFFYGFFMVPMWFWLNYVGIKSLTHHNTFMGNSTKYPHDPRLCSLPRSSRLISSGETFRCFVSVLMRFGEGLQIM